MDDIDRECFECFERVKTVGPIKNEPITVDLTSFVCVIVRLLQPLLTFSLHHFIFVVPVSPDTKIAQILCNHDGQTLADPL